MPPRLYEFTFDRILKWFTIMAVRLGVGLNSEQFTMRMSICAPKTLLTVRCFTDRLVQRKLERADLVQVWHLVWKGARCTGRTDYTPISQIQVSRHNQQETFSMLDMLRLTRS